MPLIITISGFYNAIYSVGMNITVLWDVVPCSFIEIDRRFRAAYFPRNQGDG
jgi:hypothetical protein